VLFTALTAAFSLGWQRNVQPFPLLVSIAGAFLSFRTRRDLWFVVVAAVSIIAMALGSTAVPAQRLAITRLRVAVIMIAVTVAALVIGWKQDVSEARLESKVADHYPAAAVAVVEGHAYHGILYNDYDWGGYLMWGLRSIPVVIDNRTNIHGDERIRQSLKTWAGVDQWASDPALLNAGLVIASQRKPLTSLLRLAPGFELVYEDKVAAVFVARTKEPHRRH
jgi:hypothetical protein